MKLATPLYILLIIGFLFLSISLIIQDFSVNYPEAGNVSTGFSNRYNNLNFVNSSILDISSSLDSISKAEGGWKIFEAIVALPLAVITTVFNLILAIPILGGIIIGIAADVGIPPAIVSFGIVALFVSAIIMLVKFLSKTAPV